MFGLKSIIFLQDFSICRKSLSDAKGIEWTRFYKRFKTADQRGAITFQNRFALNVGLHG